MSLKLKILGLGVLAVLATSAYAVNASATQSGHFTSEVGADHHLILKGTEQYDPNDVNKKHFLEFQGESGQPIVCTHAKYHGTISGAASTTTQQVTLRPEYIDCATKGSSKWGEVEVDVPTTCGTEVYKFTSRANSLHGTVHVNCTIKVTHPNCEITVHPQTPNGGIVYTTDTTTGVHSITADVTVEDITATYHNGICIFLGTHHFFDMNGSVTLWGENTKEEKVGITAT